MATNGKIVQGPSKWDLMMSLFEKKPVQFTNDNGETFTMRVDTLFDHSCSDNIAPWYWYPDPIRLLDYLIAGDLEGEWKDGVRLYIEYGLSPRFGYYTLLTDEECDAMCDLAYAPTIWAKLMGLQPPN